MKKYFAHFTFSLNVWVARPSRSGREDLK